MFRNKAITFMSAMVMAGSAVAADYSGRPTAFLDYNWMNKIVNKTPAQRGECPRLEVDKYKDGFKVSRKKSFYGSIGAAASRWYDAQELWAAVALSPVKDNFGILYSEVDSLNELEEDSKKKLPYTLKDFEGWAVKDSAYWESQGGVAFYLGAGIAPYHVGAMAIAKGGFANFVKKTGPVTAYVEMARKKVSNVGVSAGVGLVNISVEKINDSAIDGVAYEFDLESEEAIEAYEKMMAGDLTMAQTLSAENFPGVKQIGTNQHLRSGRSLSWGLSTPFVPILSFRSSRERYYDRKDEHTIWDESTNKKYGVYVEKTRTRMVGYHRNITKTFEGGTHVTDFPNYEDGGRIKTENAFGKFKYHYEADLGQERRLRMHIKKAQKATGLAEETCVKVPSIKGSLKYNQVKIELDLSESFVDELIGADKKRANDLLDLMYAEAKGETSSYFRSSNDNLDLCPNHGDENTFNNGDCKRRTRNELRKSFAKLRRYTDKMRASSNDSKTFSSYMTKFGKEVWSSPFVFKAFYERGKKCGAEFNYEVSGRRITRHYINRKWDYSKEDCLR